MLPDMSDPRSHSEGRSDYDSLLGPGGKREPTHGGHLATTDKLECAEASPLREGLKSPLGGAIINEWQGSRMGLHMTYGKESGI